MSETGGLPQTSDEVTAFLTNLRFADEPVPDGDLPPIPAQDEDSLVPRSFKLPVRLDRALEQLARSAGPNVSKSDLVRRYIEAGVAADLAAQQEGGEVFIPLADALRALTGLRQLPRSA